MSSERLIYLPLGGAGEIGMNAYVYGYGKPGKERLILVDLGVTFPDMDSTPGVDLILPDISWLEDRVDRLEAIFITHAHEDHIGALAPLWRKLGKPVFARNFTARIAKLKLSEQGISEREVTMVAPAPETIEAGPFAVQFVPVSHSLPEASALVIDTPAGRIVHSGDFKLDPTPGVGEPYDEAMFVEIGKVGVKAFMCDSTNVFSPHPGRSESTLSGPISDLVAGARGMVVATTFASNVARLRTLAQAGRNAGRSVCLLGRAMQRMVQVATDAGVLHDMPGTISAEEASLVPRESLMLIVTGSQGERRAASAQFSRGKYLGLSLKENDLFLFSSKTIPGNERGVLRIMNAFSEMGVDVVDEQNGRYHVSGHANRPDLERMHEILRPQMLIPMHGEHMHLRANARMAMERGVASIVPTNGTMIDLTGDAPQVVEHVETGRTYLDGSVLVGALDGVVRDRIRMAIGGHVLVTVIVDEDNQPMGEVWAEIMGLSPVGRDGRGLTETLEAQLTGFLAGANRKIMSDDDKIDEALRRLVRKITMEEIGKKPEVTVVVSRLLDD